MAVVGDVEVKFKVKVESVIPVALTSAEAQALATLGPGELRMVDGRVMWVCLDGRYAVMRELDRRMSGCRVGDSQLVAYAPDASGGFRKFTGDDVGYVQLTDAQLASVVAPLTPEDVARITGGGPAPRRLGYREINAGRSTTLPDMVPAAVLARRPPARIPTPTDLDDGLFLDAEPSGSIVRRS